MEAQYSWPQSFENQITDAAEFHPEMADDIRSQAALADQLSAWSIVIGGQAPCDKFGEVMLALSALSGAMTSEECMKRAGELAAAS